MNEHTSPVAKVTGGIEIPEALLPEVNPIVGGRITGCRTILALWGMLWLIMSAQVVFGQTGTMTGDDSHTGLGMAVETTGTVVDSSEVFERLQESMNSMSVLTSTDLDRFGDYTIEDGMKRMPGVQADRRGVFNIRGMGQGLNLVTVDGQRMASTGFGDRGVDLAGVSAGMMRELELIKVVTPDMDAEAGSGIVNLRTRHPVVDERRIEVSLGGGANTSYFDYLSPDKKASLYYADNPLEDLSITVQLNYQKENMAWESLGMVFDVTEFDDVVTDVMESVASGLHIDERKRLGGTLHLTYQPSEQSMYHLRGFMNDAGRREVRHRYMKSANGEWVDPQTTGQSGLYQGDLRLHDTGTRQYMVQAGGRHIFSAFNLEYQLGWVHTGIRKDRYQFPFTENRMKYTIDMDNRTRPVMEMIDAEVEPDDMSLQEISHIIDEHPEENVSGSFDIGIPYRYGTLNIGSSALMQTKDAFEEGAYSEYHYGISGLTLDKFDENDPSSQNLFGDTYSLPWLIDPVSAREYFKSSIPNMSVDEGLFHERSDIWNYMADEDIFAGYGMTSVDLGMITLTAGIRMEHTNAEYDGRVVKFNRFGLYDSTEDTTASQSYTQWFPHAQLQMQPLESTRVRLAYSRTHRRPDYNYLAPFEMVTAQDTTLFRGNSGIEPLISENLDLTAEHFFSDTGRLSIGVFYKQIENFVSQRESSIEIAQGEHAFLDSELFANDESSIPATERKFVNSGRTASLYGAEVSWQHNLAFLPGVLSNFGVYTNYTWTQSDYEPENRQEELSLPYQSPHVVNAAVDYIQGRFSSRISWHRSAELSTSYSAEQRLAPSTGNEEVYRDRYEDGWTDLTVTFRYRISENFRLWADLYNLMNDERLRYEYNRDYYPTGIDYRRGRSFRLGLLFSL